MFFTLRIEVTPRAYHPESVAIAKALHDGGFDCVAEVEKGKVFRLKIEAESEQDARDIVAIICLNYLVEPNTEWYAITSVW